MDQDCRIINNLLIAKRSRALYNVPSARFIPTSPYPTYTQQQLDMRRKVEILKYNGVKQNTKTNGFTKTEKWANIVSGKSSRRNIPQSTINNTNNANLICASDDLIPTLTTACDVPGPPIYLTYDPTIPLYNYIINPTYATQNNTNPATWNIFTTTELTIIQEASKKFSTTLINSSLVQTSELGTLLINDNIPSNSTTFTFTIPIGIWCVGVNELTSLIPNIDISINQIELIVRYNNSAGDSVLTQNVYDSTNLPYLSNLIINPNNTGTQMFVAVQYVGMLIIPNITLITQPGTTYFLQLSNVVLPIALEL